VFSVTSSNSGRSSAPGFTFSQAGGHLTPTSHALLPLVSVLSPNGSLSSLYSIGTDRTENVSFIIACMSVAVVKWRLLSRSLPMDVSSGFTILAVSRHVTIFRYEPTFGAQTVRVRIHMEGLSRNSASPVSIFLCNDYPYRILRCVYTSVQRLSIQNSEMCLFCATTIHTEFDQY
jgi:hypothetical protein